MRFALNELRKSKNKEWNGCITYCYQHNRQAAYREDRLLRLLLVGVETNSIQRGLDLGRTLFTKPMQKSD